MAKLWRRPQGHEPTRPGAIETDLSALRINKPTLVFLNGFFVMDGNVPWAAASLKTMEEMMAHRPAGGPPVDVYSWTHAGLKDTFNVAAYCMAPHSRSGAPATRLAAGVIGPLVLRDFKIDAAGQVTGAPLPLDEARRNLRNLTFFGYSAGGVTAQECFNAAMKMMAQAGYAEKDARAALHEVVYIGVGAVSRTTQESDRFTTLFFEATNDRIVRFQRRMWEPLRGLFARFSHMLQIRPMGEHAAMVSAAVPARHWEMRTRDGQTVREKVHALLPSSLAFIRTYHELPRYVTQDEDLSPFAKMVQYALTNAVGRTEKVSPQRLLAPPPGTDEAVAKAYSAKIAPAFV